MGSSQDGFQLTSFRRVGPLSRCLQLCVRHLMRLLLFDTHGKTGPATLKPVRSTAPVGIYLHPPLFSIVIQKKRTFGKASELTECFESDSLIHFSV